LLCTSIRVGAINFAPWHPSIGAATLSDPKKIEEISDQRITREQADGDGKGWRKKQARDANALLRCYQLTPPDGPKFQAAIVEEGDTVHVISNRGGTWKPDEALHFADLIAPEQALGEWEVTRIEPDQLEGDAEP
jgi:hypothetical protein